MVGCASLVDLIFLMPRKKGTETLSSVKFGPERLSKKEFAAYALKNGAEGHLVVDSFSTTKQAEVILLTRTRFEWLSNVLQRIEGTGAKFDLLLELISDVVSCNNNPDNDGKPPAPFSNHFDTLFSVTWAASVYGQIVYSSEKSKASFGQLGAAWRLILSKSDWCLGIEQVTRSGVHCLLRKVVASLPRDLGEGFQIEPSLQSPEVNNCAQM